MEPDVLLELYRRMVRIRGFEQRAARLYRDGQIPGFVHLSIGQEATAVGVCYHLGPDDVITSTHRGHGHALAKGLTPFEMFAELMGREDGACRGRGGSLHIADPGRGILGANGIVGAGVPIAGGGAFAARLRGRGGVSVAFLGDGAVATGAFHEAANTAGVLRTPMVMVVENNRFAEFSSYEDQHPAPIGAKAAAYGMAYHEVEGNDVVATAALMARVLEDVRAGGGPVLVEAHTLRHGGHYEGDPQLYRTEAAGLLDDPLVHAREALAEAGVPEGRVLEIDAEVAAELDEAVVRASASPHPRVEDLRRGMLVPRSAAPPARLEPLHRDGEATWKYFEAVGAALDAELAADDEVFLAGIDVGKGGNVFGITRGMLDRYPGRVVDTPIAESAIVGLGVGAAMSGLRPVVEVMYVDFMGVCFDQVVNQAAKLPYMTGGKAPMALTIRTQFGAGRSSGAQHSQSLEAMLAHVPGLTVVMPSTPADAYGLLRSAIADPNPVVVIEHRLLYGTTGYRCEPDHRVPIGQAAVRRQGDDVTIVSFSRMVHVALEAAEELAGDGIAAEVIDLRTIAPLDLMAVLESVARTNRLVVAHEANTDFGVGAEIAARVADEGLLTIDAPVRRVGGLGVPAPYAPVLEHTWLPDKARLIHAVREVVAF